MKRVKKDKVEVTILGGINDMNDEQREGFYEALGRRLKEYEEQLEKDRIEELRAMQEAHYICRNYYRLGLDRKK